MSNAFFSSFLPLTCSILISFNLPPLFPFRYTSSESANLPFCDYEYLDPQTCPSEFHLLARKLKEMDTKFFADLSVNEKKSCLFRVEITYDLNLCKLAGVDLSLFPELRRVSPADLSKMQEREFSFQKRNIDKMQPKLVSDFRTAVICEHSDNLLFLLIWFSGTILSVKAIVRFTTYPFLNQYCHDITKKRAQTPSTVQKAACKALTNALAGLNWKKNNVKIMLLEFFWSFII